MHYIPAKIEEAQRAFCRERGADFLASPGSSKLGFALATKEKTPLHGLRHNPVGILTAGIYGVATSTLQRPTSSSLFSLNICTDNSRV